MDIYEIAKRFKELNDKSKEDLLKNVETLSELRTLSLISTINCGCVGNYHKFSKWVPVRVKQNDFDSGTDTEACICLRCGQTINKIDSPNPTLAPITTEAEAEAIRHRRP